MSIPFVDQSDYLRDMEELDDLMPALDSQEAGADPVQYEIVEETKPSKTSQDTAGPIPVASPAPRSIDDFMSNSLRTGLGDFSSPRREPAPPASDGDFSDSKPATGDKQKTWFGSGGKAPESEDEAKKGLLARIEAYRATWPWLDEKITFPPNLHKKTPEKLKAILEECSNKVQNRNMTSMLGIIFSTTICAIENLCTNQLGWTDLKGFALECETDEAIKNSVKEIEIKYFASSKAMAPEARLAIALLQKLVAVTNRNRGQRLLAEIGRRSLDPRVAQQYEDL